MSSKFRIGVLGIGGVGGYIGGKLAMTFHGSDEIEIIFIARGENEKAIKSGGLKLISMEDENIIHPDIITDNPNQLGNLNLIICSVKNYDLEPAVEQIKHCISNNTIILPLLNGVEASEKITKILQAAEIWNGCIYIISHLEASGIVKVGKLVPEIYFGSLYGTPKTLNYVKEIFLRSGLNAFLSVNIEQKVWEKFVFLSPIATLTSYLNMCIGEILLNEDYRKMFIDLISEVTAVAVTKKTGLHEEIAMLTFQKIESLPFENTSSMHKDFQKGKRTEIDSLTVYVIREGKKLNVETPTYERLYNELKKK